jgi:aspartate racemase
VQGELDVAALQRALDELARRHDVLRTIYPERDGSPVQLIDEHWSGVPLRIEDAREVGLSETRHRVDALGKEEAGRVFDLERGPVMRALLVTVGHDDRVLYLSIPHIVGDGWSIGLLLSELGSLYPAYLRNETPSLPAPALQYADYVRWQRTELQGPRLRQLLDYWTAQLREVSPLLPLPLDRPRPPRQSHLGGSVEFKLSAGTSDNVRALGRDLHVTSFTILLGLFGLLLSRYSGESKVAIGSPIANRGVPDLEGVVGLLVNTLVLTVDCSGELELADLFVRAHEMLLGAHEHQDLPFERLVEELNPERSSAHSPLFQVTFVLHNTPLASEYELISGGAMFDLAVFVWDEPAGIRGSFSYNAEIFDATTIDRMVANFSALIERAIARPHERLAAISVVTDAEHATLLSWAGANAPYDRDGDVAGLFEQCAAVNPTAVALSWSGAHLTYQQLNARANAVAHLLADSGVRPGAFVGVFLERSPEALAAILGILKSGAAYVPLDPTYPAERLDFMFRDAALSVVLTDRRLVPRLPQSEARIVFIEQAADQSVSVDPSRLTRGHDVAYVMYTSGSTGQPKGVCVRHRGIVRLVRNTNYAEFGSDQVFLQLAPLSFDASTFEIWGALLNGARLAVAPAGNLSLAELGRTVREQGVTSLWLTAGLFHQVVDGGLEDYRGLRQLLAGGDVLSPSHVRRALQELDGCAVINGYGPTENTTFSCCHVMREPGDVQTPIPIGKPIGHSRAYVRDQSGNLSPIGAIGELCVGGDGVAAGYHDRPPLTAQQFVLDPLGDDAQAMLYRTGDRARWLPDGSLEFLGRTDGQVKLRGFRVELGEIEAALCEFPSIAEAVAVVRTDLGPDKTLIGYVTPQQQRQSLSPDDVRDYLAGKLPSHMLPSQIVVLPSLPLTPNGKVDRSALPAPKRLRGAGAGRPLTNLEVRLTAIWEQVLGVAGVGLDENFFDLGGNSLTAVRMFGQLRKALGRELPLATLFDAPTIEQLAAVVQAGGWRPPTRSLVAIQPGGSKRPLFLVPGVGGNVLIFARLANFLGADQPLYGLQARGLDGDETPLKTIESIAKAYVDEIRSIQSHGPYFLGGACMGGVVAFEMAQQLAADGEQVALLALIETWSPTSLHPARFRLLALLHPILFFCSGILRHLRVMWALPPKHWFAYVRDKSRIVKEMIQERDVYRGDRSLFYNDLVSATNYRAMARYVPRTYRGRMHLFLASRRPIDASRDTRLRWAKLAAAGYSLQRIDAIDSGHLFVEPHIGDLAGHLSDALAEGQSSTSRVDGRA